MKNLLSAIALTLLAFIAKAQSNDTTAHDKIFTVVERNADFPGGLQAFIQYIGNNIHYPDSARKHHIQGRVFVNFVIEKNGEVSNVKVVRSVSPALDAEAIRVIETSPRWKPGENNGQSVRVYFTIPIAFKIPPSVAGVDSSSTPEKKFHPIEKPPEYPGGLEALVDFINKNLRVGNDEGKVKVAFVIEKDGSATGIKVIQSLSKMADAEAIRIINAMPKWQPGMQDGHPVRVSYTIPINFSKN